MRYVSDPNKNLLIEGKSRTHLSSEIIYIRLLIDSLPALKECRLFDRSFVDALTGGISCIMRLITESGSGLVASWVLDEGVNDPSVLCLSSSSLVFIINDS